MYFNKSFFYRSLNVRVGHQTQYLMLRFTNKSESIVFAIVFIFKKYAREKLISN